MNCCTSALTSSPIYISRMNSYVYTIHTHMYTLYIYIIYIYIYASHLDELLHVCVDLLSNIYITYELICIHYTYSYVYTIHIYI